MLRTQTEKQTKKTKNKKKTLKTKTPLQRGAGNKVNQNPSVVKPGPQSTMNTE